MGESFFISINYMIRHLTLTELNEIKRRNGLKYHNHEYENVFLFNPGQGMLNAHAYRLCRNCAQMVEIDIDDKTRTEIKAIISRKVYDKNN